MLDVHPARNLTDHASLVERWARDVWGAWGRHHEYIKGLAESVW
ncbi:MAG: hypothetical protein ACRDF6_13985 [bacterium]